MRRTETETRKQQQGVDRKEVAQRLTEETRTGRTMGEAELSRDLGFSRVRVAIALNLLCDSGDALDTGFGWTSIAPDVNWTGNE